MPPGPVQPTPQEVAERADAAARWHDVVRAASKSIHAQPLADADLLALRWANELLERLATSESVLTMETAQQLASKGDTLRLLRTAAGDEGAEPILTSIRTGLGDLLAGRHSASLPSAMTQLRELFATAAEQALRAEVRARGSREPVGSWPRLMTTLRS